MSKFLTLVLVLAACGNDISTASDAGDPIGSGSNNGGASDAGTGDAQALTDCEDAAQHSDLAWIQEHVFTPSCISNSCHGGAMPEVGLSLEPDSARSQLVNHDSSTQSGWKRVVPGDAARSYLLVALGRGDGPMPRDGYMPLGPSGPLCAPKVEAIQRWIVSGAQ
jgi:hypothetical protein